MARALGPGLVALLLVVAGAPGAGGGALLFSLSVPGEMVTGPVVVRAQAADESVAAVRWTVDDWSRMTSRDPAAPRRFELTFDSGPVPYERRVVAVALDKERRPLYRREAVLNRGGRGLSLDVVSPVDGQQASGSVLVEVRVATPADDEAESVAVDAGGTAAALGPGAEPGSYTGFVDVPPSATAFVARLRTRLGREAERTVLVNARGVLAESDVHVVEQLVAVSKAGRPIENLVREDFSVRDERGECEVRDARLLRDAPLAVGFAIDVSVSLHHTEALKLATANQFVEHGLTDRDTAFLLAFGPRPVQVLDWTRSRPALRKGILSLADNSVAGTALYEGIQRALYRFQGQQGARALILITDGHDYEGEVTEEAALAYARVSGVKIYALGLTSSYENVRKVKRLDAEGVERLVEVGRETILQPTNEEVLGRFTAATGGKTYLVRRPQDLPRIYDEIDRDIRTQYLVSFVSSAKRRNAFHPVTVKTRRGTVQTVAGFFY